MRAELDKGTIYFLSNVSMEKSVLNDTKQRISELLQKVLSLYIVSAA